VAPCTATTTARPVTLLALKGKPSRFPACTTGRKSLCRPRLLNNKVLKLNNILNEILKTTVLFIKNDLA